VGLFPLLAFAGGLHALTLSAQPTSPAPTSATVSFLVARLKASAKGLKVGSDMRAAADFRLPTLLSDFFITQVERYLGASDSSLQRLRTLRESVSLNLPNPAQAARSAPGGILGPPFPEDQAALSRFAAEMKAQ